MTASAIPFKRGASFNVTARYNPTGADRPNLIGATITSQIRRNGSLVATLTCVLATNGMSWTMRAPTITKNWPLGYADWDVRIEVDGAVAFTSTAKLNIISSVTASP
jgi:hypothetical protein